VLYIVLVLVLAALGLLVTALITATSLWAWISIGLSVLAGVLLIADWLSRRSKRPSAVADDGVEEVTGELPEDTVEAPAEQTELMTTEGELDGSATTAIDPETEPEPAEAVTQPGETGDPGEEQTEESDLAVVSELDDEVVVVDEYPRYHLTECAWLAGRDLIPIGVSEARQLGFTPCVRCGPDAALAAKHRETSDVES